MSKKQYNLSSKIHSDISRNEMIKLVLRFSIPAILAQLTSVIMQYIDAAMVGSLGAKASAAIGLVSTTTWLMNGLCSAAVMGFTVQIAQLVGAKREDGARNVFRQSLIILMGFGLFMGILAFSISPFLPSWLGGDEGICGESTKYFTVFAFILPATQLRNVCAGALQCSGDMKTPSILSIIMCFMNVCFNMLFIFPQRTVSFLGSQFNMWGAGLGVTGAALGTALAEYITAFLMLWIAGFKSDILRFKNGGSWKLRRNNIRTAFKISLPSALEHSVMCGAYICTTLIIAPIGTVSVAANSLAITAESFCYMPGYGIGSASTTIIGQSIGAGRLDAAKKFSFVAIILGVCIMAVMGVIMYFGAAWMFSFLTPDSAVRTLGSKILRIEAFAEPLYAASIVCTGVLRGAGDTFVPSVISLVSMWGVRITLSLILVPVMGLTGAWIAMAVELCVRGILFLIRVQRGKWLNKKLEV